ncbi:VanW family protein [Bacillus salitolerans]|uniref:VanW family protein n=1 Tax=Bacillus salitolerans TaxID=1437434 RepID=A0ABW4LRG5_9BACI
MKILLLLLLIFPHLQVSTEENFTVHFNGEIIASVSRNDFATTHPDIPIIDDEKFYQFILDLEEKVYIAPVDAKIDEAGSIQKEQAGRRLHHQKLLEAFHQYYYGDGPRLIEVPTLTIYPKVDSELLASIKVKRIGQYMTYFNSRNKTRTHNIGLATESINNHVVFPGEVFSFNGVVGKRTKERGYLPAPIIVKGELSEGIGGGICQVSSTLFNAVDQAGVKIVKRYSHSKRVPYVPPGRDATVSWYGPDFTFKNNYNQPILIRAKSMEGRVYISIYSSEAINYEPRNVPSASSADFEEELLYKEYFE